jgi:hypothetical protein
VFPDQWHFGTNPDPRIHPSLFVRGQGHFISISIYLLLQRGSEKRKPRVRAQYEHISMAVSGQPVLGKQTNFYTSDSILLCSLQSMVVILCAILIFLDKSSVTKMFRDGFFQFSFPLVLGFRHLGFFHKLANIYCLQVLRAFGIPQISREYILLFL